MKRKDLLDVLADTLGCSYLSDLARADAQTQLRQIFRRIPAQDYSLREWNDAVEYITRQHASFTAAEDARRFLIDYTASGPCSPPSD